MKNYRITLAIISSLIFFGCATVPLTGRKQLSLVGDGQINQSAAQSYTQLLSDPKTKVISGTADATRIADIRTHIPEAMKYYRK